jgi:streptogramin lyase
MLLATLLAGSIAPGGAGALSVSQHPTSAPATSILGWPGGLLVGGGASGAPVSRVSTAPAFAITPGPTGPAANHVGLGPDGNPWFIGGVNEHVGEREMTFPALYELTPTAAVLRFRYPLPWNEPYAPGEFVTGPDGAVWIADWGLAHAIERYQPGGGLSVYGLPSGGTPIAIVSGPEHALWFTDSTGKIGRITTSGEISEFLIADGQTFATWGFAGPYGIAAGPDGALWFAEQTLGRIGRMTSTGELQEFPVPSGSAPAASGAERPAPRHLAIGTDGTVWFTDPGDGTIGRVGSGGEVTEYPIAAPPSGGAAAGQVQAVPDEIAIGPEGMPWVTEIGSNQLGSVDPNGSPAQTASRPLAAPGSRAAGAAGRRRCRIHRLARHRGRARPAVGAHARRRSRGSRGSCPCCSARGSSRSSRGS